MRCDLEDGVRRRVDDQSPGLHMLPAVVLDDLRAGIGQVAQHAPARLLAESGFRTSSGKPCGKVGSGCGETMPAISQWPMVVSLPRESSCRLASAAACGWSVFGR